MNRLRTTRQNAVVIAVVALSAGAWSYAHRQSFLVPDVVEKRHELKLHDMVTVVVAEVRDDGGRPIGPAVGGDASQYEVAAKVVEVLPDGNLHLESRQSLCGDNGHLLYSLTGNIRPQDVSRAGTVRSEQISDLCIEKKQEGPPHQSTGWTWLTDLIDLLGTL
jgi:hypothetical protein